MKAVAYQQCLPIGHAESLLDVDLPEPTPGSHDLLVEVHAVRPTCTLQHLCDGELYAW